MSYKGLLLIVAAGITLGALGLGTAQACTCPTATSVTVTWPNGGWNAEATMGATTPGYKEFECQASATPTCNTPDLLWSYQSITGITITWQPPTPLGGTVTIKLQNLPSLNSKFGQHWVKATVDGKYDLGYYRLFFMPENTDHPASPPDPLRIGTEENWYYYWKQTGAFCGDAAEVHWSSVMNLPILAFTQWTGSDYQTWIGPHIVDMVDGEQIAWPIKDGPDKDEYRAGIDFYGFIVRHEDRHRELHPSWFPQGWPWLATDNDEGTGVGDGIPDAVEPTLPQATEYGGPFLGNNLDSDNDDNPDGEDYVCWTQDYYTLGSHHTSDWSYRGYQYNQ